MKESELKLLLVVTAIHTWQTRDDDNEDSEHTVYGVRLSNSFEDDSIRVELALPSLPDNLATVGKSVLVSVS